MTQQQWFQAIRWGVVAGVGAIVLHTVPAQAQVIFRRHTRPPIYYPPVYQTPYGNGSVYYNPPVWNSITVGPNGVGFSRTYLNSPYYPAGYSIGGGYQRPVVLVNPTIINNPTIVPAPILPSNSDPRFYPDGSLRAIPLNPQYPQYSYPTTIIQH